MKEKIAIPVVTALIVSAVMWILGITRPRLDEYELRQVAKNVVVDDRFLETLFQHLDEYVIKAIDSRLNYTVEMKSIQADHGEAKKSFLVLRQTI